LIQYKYVLVNLDLPLEYIWEICPENRKLDESIIHSQLVEIIDKFNEPKITIPSFVTNPYLA